MTATAPTLTDHLPADAITAWADVSADWQRRLQPALGQDPAPTYFLEPQTEAELALILKQAQATGKAVLVCGHGSKLGWGDGAAVVDWVVSTARLNRLIENAAGDLTLTVEAGMTLAQIQSILEPHQLFVALDPAYAATATIGGIIATADAGSLRLRYGGVRDMLLGIQFVRADGEIAKAGGRVVKNVAGYDLMKLLTGAYGTLGVITQVTLRTYPIPELYRTVLMMGAPEQLMQANRAIAQSNLTPISQDWLSSELVNATAQGNDLTLALRFGNLSASVLEQTEEVRQLGQQLGLSTRVLVGKPEMGFWQDVSRQLEAHRQKVGDPETVFCKFGGLPSRAGETLQTITTWVPDTKVRLHSSGLGQLRGKAQDWTGERIQQLRSHCQDQGGFLTLLEAPRTLKNELDVWGYSGNALPVMQRIKQQFDPQKTLNPGRFVVG